MKPVKSISNQGNDEEHEYFKIKMKIIALLLGIGIVSVFVLKFLEKDNNSATPTNNAQTELNIASDSIIQPEQKIEEKIVEQDCSFEIDKNGDTIKVINNTNHSITEYQNNRPSIKTYQSANPFYKDSVISFYQSGKIKQRDIYEISFEDETTLKFKLYYDENGKFTKREKYNLIPNPNEEGSSSVALESSDYNEVDPVYTENRNVESNNYNVRYSPVRIVSCSLCRGTGIEENRNRNSFSPEYGRICPLCGGSGKTVSY